jgi:hypothetical protein
LELDYLFPHLVAVLAQLVQLINLMQVVQAVVLEEAMYLVMLADILHQKDIKVE